MVRTADSHRDAGGPLANKEESPMKIELQYCAM